MGISTIVVDDENYLTVQTDDDLKFELTENDVAGLLPEGTEPVSAEKLSDASKLLERQIGGLSALGRKLISSANPDNLEIHAELKFAGSAGIPLLASTGADAGIKLVLKWDRDSQD